MVVQANPVRLMEEPMKVGIDITRMLLDNVSRGSQFANKFLKFLSKLQKMET